jgi:hypothetical protein
MVLSATDAGAICSPPQNAPYLPDRRINEYNFTFQISSTDINLPISRI